MFTHYMAHLSLYAASSLFSFRLYSECVPSFSCWSCFFRLASLSWYILYTKQNHITIINWGSINHIDHKIQQYLLFFNFSIFFWFPHICFTCFFSVWKWRQITSCQPSTAYKLTILILIKFVSYATTHQKWMCANFHNSVSIISGDPVI